LWIKRRNFSKKLKHSNQVHQSSRSRPQYSRTSSNALEFKYKSRSSSKALRSKVQLKIQKQAQMLLNSITSQDQDQVHQDSRSSSQALEFKFERRIRGFIEIVTHKFEIKYYNCCDVFSLDYSFLNAYFIITPSSFRVKISISI